MSKNAKAKYYVVWQGAKPGIYTTWKECEAQVKGFPDARFKAFPTRREAEEAFRSAPPARKAAGPRKEKPKPAAEAVDWESLSVDAACSGNPGVMEYRGVWTATGKEIFRQGPFSEGTNNIGEFLAIVHGLAWLAEKGDKTTVIYSDSRIAQGWVDAGTCRTKLKPTRNNARLFEMIRRAEHWLKTHRWENPVIKWETKEWGEIPADFGRK